MTNITEADEARLDLANDAADAASELIQRHGIPLTAEAVNKVAGLLAELMGERVPRKPPTYAMIYPEDGSEPYMDCPHDWVYTGEAYGGDEPGEGRSYCCLCLTDGDA